MSAGTQTQTLPVPDWNPSATPTASGWIKGNLTRIVRAGLQFASTGADVVTLLGSATGSEPVSPNNPNVLATFYGGKAASAVDIPACTYFATLRQSPPPVGGVKGTPTPGLVLELQGTSTDVTVPVSIAMPSRFGPIVSLAQDGMQIATGPRTVYYIEIFNNSGVAYYLTFSDGTATPANGDAAAWWSTQVNGTNGILGTALGGTVGVPVANGLWVVLSTTPGTITKPVGEVNRIVINVVYT